MKSFAEIDIEQNGDYLKLLTVLSKLSKLFSENEIPYIQYRIAENVFCRSFQANNLSRSDTAFDANYQNIGIGLKTFMCPSKTSTEKIAEFNTLSGGLKAFSNKDLATKLAEFRNERIELAKRLYGIENAVYHIVARRNNGLFLFETDYDLIDIKNIGSVKQNDKSIQFEDGKNLYSFNFSKSTLYRQFDVPESAFHLPVNIIEDPYSLLLELLAESNELLPAQDLRVKGVNYVILPLYGIKNKQKFVFENSGLNQWNAAGRKRDFGEVYIRVPTIIHHKYPDFFPDRDVPFSLEIPIGDKFSAKICQQGEKALMTNPNKALADWLLRRIFQLSEGELATYEKLNFLGFDSVIVTKDEHGKFSIDKAAIDSYEQFLNE